VFLVNKKKKKDFYLQILFELINPFGNSNIDLKEEPSVQKGKQLHKLEI